MKKERPTRLTLARETILELADQELRHPHGGSVWPGSGPACQGNKPPSYETSC